MEYKATKYVIQREDGTFYWRGNATSLYGFTDKFSDAYLFQTIGGAKRRLFTANPLKADILEVEITVKNIQQIKYQIL